jgi:hypothetical protein
MRLTNMDGARGCGALRAGCSGLALFLLLLLSVAPVRGAEAPTAPPQAMDNMMSPRLAAGDRPQDRRRSDRRRPYAAGNAWRARARMALFRPPRLRSWRPRQSRLDCNRLLPCIVGSEPRPSRPQPLHSPPPAAAARGTEPGAAVTTPVVRSRRAGRFQRRVHLQSALADERWGCG